MFSQLEQYLSPVIEKEWSNVIYMTFLKKQHQFESISVCFVQANSTPTEELQKNRYSQLTLQWQTALCQRVFSFNYTVRHLKQMIFSVNCSDMFLAYHCKESWLYWTFEQRSIWPELLSLKKRMESSWVVTRFVFIIYLRNWHKQNNLWYFIHNARFLDK